MHHFLVEDDSDAGRTEQMVNESRCFGWFWQRNLGSQTPVTGWYASGVLCVYKELPRVSPTVLNVTTKLSYADGRSDGHNGKGFGGAVCKA